MAIKYICAARGLNGVCEILKIFFTIPFMGIELFI